MSEIQNCFYRVSIKALVLNETRDKFLLVREGNGRWELPGGGLDWGTTPHEDLPREISEEMGLKVTWIAENPSYFLSGQAANHEHVWIVNVVYETELEHLDFTPSDECTELAFVNKDDIASMNVYGQIPDLAERFDPANHPQ